MEMLLLIIKDQSGPWTLLFTTKALRGRMVPFLFAFLVIANMDFKSTRRASLKANPKDKNIGFRVH